MCEATGPNSECTISIHRQDQANESTLYTVDTASALQPTLRSCDLCGTPYARGTLGGESLHRSHVPPRSGDKRDGMDPGDGEGKRWSGRFGRAR